MIGRSRNIDKQLLAEQLWLSYFNDVLYQDGIITAASYHKMIHRINSREKINKQKKENRQHG